MDKEKFNTLMYFLIKEAARYDFSEFLEEIDITFEEYEIIRNHLKETYGIKPYI